MAWWDDLINYYLSIGVVSQPTQNTQTQNIQTSQPVGTITPQKDYGNFEDVLKENKNLNFVNRLYNKDKYPKVMNPDGTYSTHRMASANIDGKPIAFPTIVYDKNTKQLKQLQGKEAIDYAIKNKEYIEFASDEEANAFANNGYKKSFPKNYF